MGVLVNPFRFAPAGPSPSLYYGTAEALAGSTPTTTYATKVTNTPTLVSGRKYMLLWGVDLTFASSVTGFAALRVDSVIVDETSLNPHETAAPPDKITLGGMAFYTGGGTDVPFDVQVKVSSGSTVTAENARVTYMALGPNDYTQEDLARQTTTSTSFQTVSTLTFSDTGNYVVIAHFLVDGSVTDPPYFELSDGTTTISYRVGTAIAGSRYRPVTAILDIGSVAGSKSVTLKHKAGLGATIGISGIRMVALQLNRFANAYKTVLGSDSTGTDTSYTTALTQTFTPAAASHLAIACWFVTNNDATQSSYARFVDGGSAVNEHIEEKNSGSSGAYMPAQSHHLATYSAASRTQTLERKSEGTLTTTVQAKSAILTLDLNGLS